ncbi:MAG: acetylglutamate kinase [Elusimicrobia bacterium]|nr:acetylglutamate kinase [Elusimicrobiota bacterium]
MTPIQHAAAKARNLTEALPWISRSEGKTFVIKYGGAAMVDEELRDSFARDVTLLKKVGVRVAIVHGGGKEITETATKLGIETRFVDGQRYTCEDTVDVVQMVLAGRTNTDIVRRINLQDGDAVGLSGVDAGLLRAEKFTENGADLGLVGNITEVRPQHIELLLSNGFMPVIAPLGVDENGTIYNINADVAAAKIAEALKAEKLVYLSDVEGILKDGERVTNITEPRAEELISSGVISKGMIPKVRSAFDALNAGVGRVHLIDGREKHSLLLEIFTDKGVGTMLVRGEPEGACQKKSACSPSNS